MKTGKQLLKFASIIFFLSVCTPFAANAQFDIGAELVSRYLWRGQLLGSGPALQPSISYTTRFDTSGVFGLEIGSWGSYGIASGNDGTEADIYATLITGPLSFTLTDYFFPNDNPFADGASFDNYFEYGEETGHVFELIASFDGVEKLPLSVSLAYNLGGADPDNSLYVNLAYPLTDALEISAGLGNGWYTYEEDGSQDDKFGLVNLALSYSKEVPITEKFSLPLSGTFAINPNLEKIFIVFGISF